MVNRPAPQGGKVQRRRTEGLPPGPFRGLHPGPPPSCQALTPLSSIGYFGKVRVGKGGRSVKLRQLTERVYVLEQPVNIGFLAAPEGDRCLVVDTGLDGQAAKKILQVFEEKGWELAGILNTHHHADHVGGNATLARATGAPIYAHAGEAFFIEHPEWEPRYLHGGAAPSLEMRNKFLQAEPSRVSGHLLPGEPLPEPLTPWDLTLYYLPGHTHDMIGIACDGVLFSGDAFLGAEVLAKHGIPYLNDVAASFATLRRLLELDPAACHTLVPGHGPVMERDESREVIRANLDRLEGVAASIRYLLRKPLTGTALLHGLLKRYNLEPDDMARLALYQTTLNAYLTYLADRGEIGYHLAGLRVSWHLVER